jgi:hypothetical protein
VKTPGIQVERDLSLFPIIINKKGFTNKNDYPHMHIGISGIMKLLCVR